MNFLSHSSRDQVDADVARVPHLQSPAECGVGNHAEVRMVHAEIGDYGKQVILLNLRGWEAQFARRVAQRDARQHCRIPARPDQRERVDSTGISSRKPLAVPGEPVGRDSRAVGLLQL